MIKQVTALFAGAVFSLGALAESGDIEVVVKSLRSDKGDVIVSLHDSKDTFLSSDDKHLAKTKGQPKDGTATVVFEDMPYGTYAVALFHDEDADGEMKTVYGTIPVEGMGVSNDAKGTMGPPQFKDAKFEHKGEKTEAVINVTY